MKAAAILLLSSACCLGCQTLQRGDLLFHLPATSNHITSVTQGRADHVAIYLGGDSVLEAIPRQGVVVTSLQEVLLREDGTYASARVKGTDTERSINTARQWIGLPYDSVFMPGTEALYCSELVQLSYVNRQGERIFEPIPMSFHDDSGRITPYWTQFYSRLHMEVPEGEPGSNPSDMMRRKVVVIKKHNINVRNARANK